MSKIKHNPKSRRILSKFIVNSKFDPYVQSIELAEELSNWHVPSNRYIKKDVRGKQMISLDESVISYLAFEMQMGTPEVKLVARMIYYIKFFAKEIGVTKQEMYDAITDLDNEGFVPTMFAEHLKPQKDI